MPSAMWKSAASVLPLVSLLQLLSAVDVGSGTQKEEPDERAHLGHRIFAAVVEPAPFQVWLIAFGTAAEVVPVPLMVISKSVPPFEKP